MRIQKSLFHHQKKRGYGHKENLKERTRKPKKTKRESERADKEAQKAKREAERADKEAQKAKRESERANKLAEKLKKLGIDPTLD